MNTAAQYLHIPGIGLDELTGWLRSRGAAVVPPISAKRIGEGQSNLIFLIQDAVGSRWVLRRPPTGELLASAHNVAREAGVLTALAATTVPVPEIIGLIEPGEVSGARAEEEAPMLVMAFVDGIAVDSVVAGRRLSVDQRSALGTSMAATLAQIHEVDLEATGLSTLASHTSYAARQLRRWSAQWELSRTREQPVIDSLARRLATAAPEHEQLTLVHGDFHLRNVIAAEDGSVRTVLDWELCTLGDPIADLGSLLAYWPEPGETALPEFAATTLEGFPGRSELAEAYLRATGRDDRYLGFWHTFGLWKLAVIAEGVRRRALERTADTQGEPMTIAAIDSIVDRAERTADSVRL